MPRDLPLGNGRLLVNFDSSYRVRDLYYPHVGRENHTIGHPFRFGVWCDGRFSWIEAPEWERDLRYRPETLVTQVTLTNQAMGLRLHCSDAVDFHEDVYIRHVQVENLADNEREVRLFFCHDFHISESSLSDTAYYRPWQRLLIHYKGSRYFAINACTDRGCGLDQFSTGNKEIEGAEGTWRDAEDGKLEGNPIAQGSVDSAVAVHVRVGGKSRADAYYWMSVGNTYDDVRTLDELVVGKTPAEMIRRTANYWHLWANKEGDEYADLAPALVELHKRSLLVMRTQVDETGAIIAATDSDIAQFGRDTYAYMWPRDGALVARAFGAAGFGQPIHKFFDFCSRIITKEGFFLHKYNADGSLGSSWHPWVYPEDGDLPVQEDETALVIWALWHHFERFRNIETIKPLYRPLIMRAANWMCEYRDPRTGLPRPSYDLWEVRYGIHAWTLGTVYGGLQAAASFARAFGETDLADKFAGTAEEIKTLTTRHFWQESLGRFVRTVYRVEGGALEPDPTLDASLCGLYRFGMYEASDPRIASTLNAMKDRLWVKTDVGGMARHDGDWYHRVSQDVEHVPGNPWFVCTAWLAQWYIAQAENAEQLEPAREVLHWILDRALPSGVLAEQVNPYTDQPLSVSPLTWSHAEYIIAVLDYVDKAAALESCAQCGLPLRPRRRHGHVLEKDVSAHQVGSPAPGSA